MPDEIEKFTLNISFFEGETSEQPNLLLAALLRNIASDLERIDFTQFTDYMEKIHTPTGQHVGNYRWWRRANV